MTVTKWISTQFRALVLTVTFFALMVSSDGTVALNTIHLDERVVILQDEPHHWGLVVSKHMRFRRREISFTSSEVILWPNQGGSSFPDFSTFWGTISRLFGVEHYDLTSD